MKAIKFPQQTFVLAENQPEYTSLPVHAKVEDVQYKDEQGKVQTAKDITTELTACFELDPDEIAQVVATGKIWYTQVVYGAQFQPIRMSVLNPFEPALLDSYVANLATLFAHVLKTDVNFMERVKANIAQAFVNAGQWLNISEASLREVGNLGARNFVAQLFNDGKPGEKNEETGMIKVHNNSEAFRVWVDWKGYGMRFMGSHTGVHLPDNVTREQFLKEWEAYEKANNPKYKL